MNDNTKECNHHNLEYRFANINDINSVYTFEKEIFSDPWSKNVLREELHNQYGNSEWKKIYLACKGNRILGYINSYLILDELQIMRIAVSKIARNKGIASQLLLDNMLLAKSFGATKASLEVKASNTAAINLYRKNGFVVVGKRDNYYENFEDAVLMDANLSEIGN